jgi:hypothetical protein
METPRNHSKLAWTCIRASAVGGAIVVLLCQTALGQTIPNPSFETDTFATSPGYISVNTPITGWTANPADEVGLNPAGGQSPFADNGAIPNGNNVAFVQAGSAADSQQGTLSTTISGLTIGTTYKVNLRANARSGQAPTLRLSIDGTEIIAMTMHSAGPNNPYWYIAFEFTATATSQVLGVLNDVTSSDNTLLVDDFSIAPSSGKWVVDAWNDDATSGLDSSFYYTHAYKFGNAGNFSINGVAFTGLGGNNPQVPGSFSTTFLTYGPAGGGATVTGDSTNLAVNFDYGYSIPVGSAESITLNGLTPGTNYVATVFSYAWDDLTTVPNPLEQRWATFSMGNDRLTVQQDQFGLGNGIRISYTYTADSSGNATINMTPVNIFGNYSFHVCGFANREAVSRNVAPTITTQPHTLIVTPGLGATFTVSANGLPAPAYQWRYNGGNIGGAQASSYTVAAASGINVGAYDVIVSNVGGSITSAVAHLIVGIPLDNPSFEVDTFTVYPGYCSGNAPITGWTLDVLGGGGLNPAGGTPFASNGPVPDGIQFAFIQAAGDILHQTVGGFSVGDAYYVHYYEGARAGNASPGMEVRVGGAIVLAAHTIPSGANSYFETFSDLFVATNASLDVAFVKSNPVAGDTTAVLDDVAVVHIAAGTAPFVTRSPQPVLASVADSATFWAQGVGSPPLAFQWLKNGTAVPGATNEVLTLDNIQKAAEADYSLRITNSSGSATSVAAHLTVYEPIPDLFNTGVDDNRAALADGDIDAHYQLFVNPDTGSTNAIIEPAVAGAWLANSTTSKWIGPQANTSASAVGDYVYRTVIDLTGRDPSTLIINGQWATDNVGNDIQVNGHSTGNGKSLAFNGYTAFNIYGTNGLLVVGKNTIDFLVNNAAPAGYTGLRVEIIRSNLRIPPGVPPTILTAPVSQQAIEGDTITFTATAGGTAPLGYQWTKDNAPLAGQTTLTLVLTNVTVASNGLYSITVTNSAGSTNSVPAKLEVMWNTLPGFYGTGVATNGTLAAGGSVDPHYILTVSADPNFPGPNAMLLNDVWPVGTWIANGPSSKWIAPQTDQSGVLNPDGTYSGNAEGDYTYQTSFTLAAADLNKIRIDGGWAVDNTGVDILVNGVSKGITNSAGFGSFTPFMITANNGLVAGPNILDFVLNNAPVTPNPTGLRVNLRGLMPNGFTPYSLDMNTPPGSSLNASDGTEPLDNWWANEFTALAGGNLITEVDFGCATVTAGEYAVASLYRVTGAGGDPALGAVRLYSQTFKPVPGTSAQPSQNKIILISPVTLNAGDRFLVAISMTNVIGLSPNDVYPFPIDGITDSTGSYWDRSAPNTFNLDDLSQAKPIDQALAAGGFVPGDYGGHLYIRAIGISPTTSGPTLNIKLSGGSAVVSWSPTSAGQQLNSAPTPTGPWKPITGAASPYTATLGATNTFYRVSQ